ncbi:MAG TPA: anion permease [Clostridium sp.]|nr:anion permease [Clostridium sp.]
MHSSLIFTVIIIVLALSFDFINGFHDTATAVATSITTRALSPRNAIIICCICNFIGAFAETAVAKTIGDNIVDSSLMAQWVIMCILITSIIWNLLTWYFAIPSSSSHALIGALVGAGISYNNSLKAVNWHNLFHSVILWLFLSPVIGFIVGYILMKFLNLILAPFNRRSVNKVFLKLQILAGAFMAFNHGSNDAQKSMGIITMALLSGGLLSSFEVPTWVILLCALAMALGTSIGGKKIIKTMGSGMTKLTPVNGFAAQTGATSVILTATLFKAPVSTTHIITTTIMGIGACKRVKNVKWGIAKNIVWTWILTIPTTALLSYLLIFIVKLFV